MTKNTRCKICGETAVETFRIPSSKRTGQPIPEAPDDCTYYECTRCRFCFTDILDAVDHAGVYDESYWNNQDPDWHGRVSETLRLVLLANTLIAKDPAQIEILDFGCGMGTFVQTAREKLGMQAWGHDIIEPKFGKEFFLKGLPEKKFDIIVSCEVLEHLPFPYEILKGVLRSLKPGGVFAFQTAYYDPKVCKRDWWYVGPANGHVSLYSVGAFDVLFRKFGGQKRQLWNNYAGIQAWQIGPDDGFSLGTAPSSLPISKVCDAADFFNAEFLATIKNDLDGIPRMHRKQWEFAMIFLALRKLAMLEGTKVGLSMGSGIETVLYAIARQVKHLTVTDLYSDYSSWDGAKAVDPEEHVRRNKPFSVDDSRLSALHMDMRKLEFDDGSFDFAYSSCAFEHIGQDEDFLQHLNEVHRVLKDGGVYVLTTEFTFDPDTIPIKHNYLFSADHLSRILEASRFSAEMPCDARITEQSANFPLPGQVEDLAHAGSGHFLGSLSEFCVLPHVQLLQGKHPFTSCLLVLRKGTGQAKRKIVFNGLAESRAYMQACLQDYRGMIARALTLNPFAFLPRRTSAYYAPHVTAGSTGPGTANTIFHTNYCWLGTGLRKIQITLYRERGYEEACRVELRVHRYRTLDPATSECCFHETVALPQAEGIEKEFAVAMEDDYIYAVLAVLQMGTCLFSDIQVRLSSAAPAEVVSFLPPPSRQLSKVCDAADFFTPEYIDVANNELHEAPYLHRKQWEFAMIFLALKKRGMLDPARTGLSMGSGNERVLYAVSQYVRHLTVTDLYNAETLWECARASNPDEYIRKSKPFPVDESRISALNMDMRELAFDDGSFDFAYSSCAFEHIGEDTDFLRHLNEVYRVLKDGGIYVLTTEFTYENNTIPIKNNFLFSADHLCRLIGESSFTPEKHFNARIAEQSANFPIPAALDDLFPANSRDSMRTIASSGAVPHVQLLRGGHPFTSCLFVLQKDVSRRNKGDIVVDGLAESRRFLQERMDRYGTPPATPGRRAAGAAPRWMERLYRAIKRVVSS